MLAAMITSPLELRSLLRSEIKDGQREVVRLTDEQMHILNTLRGVRRAAVVGGAGTGKTMLAIAKAQQLAGEGFETLLVCFNSPLARLLADETREVAQRTGRLTVSTFHQLAEDLGREAGTLPEKPDPVTDDWFAETMPTALDEAIGKLGPRYHAIVVDEGQDFDAGWLASLDGLLIGGREDVMYVFHDPAQSIFRPDQIGELGLTEYPLDFNCRNPAPVHALLEPLALGGLASQARRTDGREPELIKADVDAETIEAAAQGAPSAGGRRGRRPGLDRRAERGRPREVGRLEAARLRQPGPVERRGRRRREAAGAGGGGRAGAAGGRGAVRVRAPVQGPRAAGDRAARGAARRPGPAGSVAVHRGVTGDAAPGGHRADGGAAAVGRVTESGRCIMTTGGSERAPGTGDKLTA